VTDGYLSASAAIVARIESDIQRHVAATDSAFEKARGQAAYRGAVALRKALGEWTKTRTARREQQE
jgi:hypothetical protein